MADINITIPLPVLIGAQYFKVRYRLIGSPTWTNFTNQTNAPFTIFGLSVGTYELGFTLVKSDSPLFECDEVIKYFEIDQISPCLEFSFELIQTDEGLFYLSVGYVLPSPLVEPCGGYDIIYGIFGGVMTTVHYASLPPSPLLLPATNNDYEIQIRSLNCDGNYVICDDVLIEHLDISCTPATIVSAEIIFVGSWFVKLTITQSTPYTNPFVVAYQQNNLLTFGVNDPGGVINLAASAMTTILQFPVSPNLSIIPTNGQPTIIYDGSISDHCLFNTKWQAFYTLT